MTAVAVELRRGRDLVEPRLFDRLVAFCADEYGLERVVAERVQDQAIALLYVMGTTRSGDTMAPSAAVDPGWHTFMLHSPEYTEWCHKHFGYYLHHVPNSKTRTRGLMVDVVGRVREAGFVIDEALWGTAASCNPPTCCGDGPCC
ncbi:hypothetical protein ACIQMR_22045 [Streptomyces sp. NPDC091376]|uniref:hypothetical protein n=1 Tax=Streptomyces sp. NPDC091376 TaxID=3365994 RepID=UPI0038159F3B